MRPSLEVLEGRLAPATRTWAGLGLDIYWSTHANWVGGEIPQPNDDLVFPGGAPRLVNINDLPGYIFNSITLGGAHYLISGNILGIRSSGIVQTVSGPNTITFDVVFIGPEVRPMGVAAGGSLTVQGRLRGSGGFAKTGTGTLTLTGPDSNDYASQTTVQEGTLLLSKPSGVLAVPGDLVVGDSVGGAESDVVRLTANNQITPLANVTVNGAGLLDLNGIATALPGLTLAGGRVHTGAATLTLNGNITANAAPTPAVLRGRIDLGILPRTITVADGPSPDDLLIQATMTAGDAITKAGTGKLVLAEANNLAGTVTVAAGVLNLRNGGALGSATAGTVVAAGAALELQGGIAVGAESLTLTGAGVGGGVLFNVVDNNSWGGDITFQSDVRFVSTAGGLRLNGAIASSGGPWSLTKAGAGSLAFGGPAANRYTGTTVVREGVLLFGKLPGIAAVAGPLMIGDGTDPTRSAVVQLEAGDQIAPFAPVMVVGNSTLDLNNFTETVESLTFTGGTISTGAGTLRVDQGMRVNAAAVPVTITGRVFLTGSAQSIRIERGSAAADLVLNGTLTGGSFVKVGPGIVRVISPNTATNLVTIAEGAFIADGTLTGNVEARVGALLGGSGTFADVTVAGTLAPGASPGRMRVRDLSFSQGSAARMELNGTDPGTGHDQVVVSGTLTLTGATLVPTLGFRPLPGNRFTIFDNTGLGPVVGTFTGLSEGSRLVIDGRPFVISYRGGDGNDVTLTEVSRQSVTTVKLSPTNARFGTVVSVIVNVRPSTGTGVPTGQVTIRDGATVIATSSLTNGDAQVFGPFTAGSHNFTAEYTGDATFAPSSSTPAAIVVAKGLTAMRLIATPSVAGSGQGVQLTAFVDYLSEVSLATGNVIFRRGNDVIGTVPYARDGSGTRFAVAGLPVGVHTFTATYEGDANWEPIAGSVEVRVTQALPPEERYVAALYRSLLQRDPEPAGLANWAGHLRQGTTREQVVLAVQGSVEYRTLVVQNLYRQHLGRTADPGGLVAFATFLGSGGTVEQARAAIVGSPEYYQTRGGGTNAGWLNAIYRDALNRGTDPAGLSAHLAGLAGGVSRQRVADIVFGSAEYRMRLVHGLYQRYLGRDADPVGLNGFVAALVQGMRPEHLAAIIAGSAEYAQRT